MACKVADGSELHAEKTGEYNKDTTQTTECMVMVHSDIENTDSHTVDEGTIASKVQELVVTQNTDTPFLFHLG